ncbi:MAG: hypothetical protein LBM76_02370 [Mycoplasmataceae bacterium]|nr:hypothetical protein [Mycoplasmataceae bacterium]
MRNQKQFTKSVSSLKIEHRTLLLMLAVASTLTWLIFFVIASLIAILFIDHTYVGWFIDYDELTSKYSLTAWSWLFISFAGVITLLSIFAAVWYLLDIREHLRELEYADTKRKLAIARAAGKITFKNSALNFETDSKSNKMRQKVKLSKIVRDSKGNIVSQKSTGSSNSFTSFMSTEN